MFTARNLMYDILVKLQISLFLLSKNVTKNNRKKITISY